MPYLSVELVDPVLALEVPDLDGGAGGSAQPVSEQNNITARNSLHLFSLISNCIVVNH